MLLLLALVAALLPVAYPYAPVDSGFQRDLYYKIYTDLLNEYPCVRLLRSAPGTEGADQPADTSHGCGSSHPSAVSGAIVNATTPEQVSKLSSSPPRGPWVPVLSALTFSRASLRALVDAGGVAAAVVLPSSGEGVSVTVKDDSGVSANDADISADISADASDADSVGAVLPKRFGFSPESGTLLFPGEAGGGDGHVWNADGDGMRYEEYTFPVWRLSADGARAFARAMEFNGDASSFPRYAAEIQSFMYAGAGGGKSAVRRCIEKARCDPLGGYSVIASPTAGRGVVDADSPGAFAREVGIDGERETVLVTATADATAMFHDLAVGAQGSLSGTIVAVSAFRAVSSTLATHVDSPALGGVVLRNLVLAVLTGEAFDRTGSRRLARDIAERPACEKGPSDGAYCSNPYIPSLAYEYISLDRMAAVIDVGEVGGSATEALYARVAGGDPTSSSSSALRDAMSLAAADLPGYPYALPVQAATPVPGAGLTSPIPPSPLTSFLAFNSTLPSLRLTSWDLSMDQRFYRSRFDRWTPPAAGGESSSSVPEDNNGVASTDPATVDPDRLCSAARSLASSLVTLVMGANTTAGSAPFNATLARRMAADRVNCTEARRVLGCLASDTEGGVCAGMATELLNVTRAAGSPIDTFSHYVGVARQTVVTEYMAFLRRWVTHGELGRNASSWYHNAIPAGVEWDRDNGVFAVPETLRDPLWVESRWGGDIGIRIYLEDSQVSQTVVVIMGVLITAGTYCFGVFTKRHWLATMKAD